MMFRVCLKVFTGLGEFWNILEIIELFGALKEVMLKRPS